MSSKRARVGGLALVLLPLLYVTLLAVFAYMPSGKYPYTPLEEWMMGFGEVALICGIALVLASSGRWSVAGAAAVAVPVGYVLLSQTLSVTIPSWGSLGVLDKALLPVWAAALAVGLYMQLAERPFGFLLRHPESEAAKVKRKRKSQPTLEGEP